MAIVAGEKLFDRQFIVKIGDIAVDSTQTITPLRCSFKVDRDKTPLANSAEVRIWNLNKDQRGALEAESEVTCEIQAGYPETLGQIFFGTLRDIYTVREGPDLILIGSASDSEELLLESKVSLSFAKDTALRDVLSALVKAVGMTDGNLDQVLSSGYSFLSSGTKLETAMSFSGSAANELNWFCRSVGLEWSVQNGAFVGAIVGEPSDPGGPLFSPGTGLLGDIEVIKNSEKKIEKSKKRAAKEKGRILAPLEIAGRAQLTSDLFPGRAFRVESPKMEGDFVCTETQHVGDTEGNEWYVAFHGDPIPSATPGASVSDLPGIQL